MAKLVRLFLPVLMAFAALCVEYPYGIGIFLICAWLHFRRHEKPVDFIKYPPQYGERGLTL